MTQLLKKLSDSHYVVVTDEPIKVGDYIMNMQRNHIYPSSVLSDDVEYRNKKSDVFKKITHSNKPLEDVDVERLVGFNLTEKGFDKIKPLDLSTCKSLVGEVDVEKKVNDYVQELIDCKSVKEHEKTWISTICHKIYNQCLEDNKDRDKSTEILNHLCDKMELISQEMIDKDPFQLGRYRTFKYIFDYIKSITQSKDTWECEFIDGQLKLK